MYRMELPGPCEIFLPLSKGKKPNWLGRDWVPSDVAPHLPSVIYYRRIVVAKGPITLPCDLNAKALPSYVFVKPPRKDWTSRSTTLRNMTSHTDTSLTPRARYYYRVKAVGLKGQKSIPSKPVWVIAGWKPPAAPKTKK